MMTVFWCLVLAVVPLCFLAMTAVEDEPYRPYWEREHPGNGFEE